MQKSTKQHHPMQKRGGVAFALACLHSSVVFSFLFPCSFLLFSTVGIIVYLCFLGNVQSDLFCYLFGQNPINIYIWRSGRGQPEGGVYGQRSGYRQSATEALPCSPKGAAAPAPRRKGTTRKSECSETPPRKDAAARQRNTAPHTALFVRERRRRGK